MKRDAGNGNSFETNGSAFPSVPLFSELKILSVGIDFEKQAHEAGFRLVAGVDEVGRGCLAGPVVAGACILDISKPLPKGLNDSKKLTAAQRERIAEELRANCIAYSVGAIDAEEIDRINILQATFAAMQHAVEQLKPRADFLLIDAVQLKGHPLPQKSIIKGDAISASIAAASIIAKTYRDRLMIEHDRAYPQYGFSSHVGYGTKQHLSALREHGPCPLHRRSFRGVV